MHTSDLEVQAVQRLIDNYRLKQDGREKTHTEAANEAYNLTYRSAQFIVVLSAGSLSAMATFLTGGGIQAQGLLVSSWISLFVTMVLGIFLMILVRNRSLAVALVHDDWAEWWHGLADAYYNTIHEALSWIGAVDQQSIQFKELLAEKDKEFIEKKKAMRDKHDQLQEKGGNAVEWIERFMYGAFVLGLILLSTYGAILVFDPR